MNSLKNKIALITGSTSGIGASSAEMFAKAGATVVVTGRNEKRGYEVVDRIVTSGNRALFCKLDIRSEKSIKKIRDDLVNKFGRIDILFNNAGIFPPTSVLENITIESWEQIMDINCSGVYRTVKVFIEDLIKTRGVILNTASVAGMHSYASGKTYAYSASKAAVIQFTRMLAKNYGRDVRINCICPGVVDTPIFINRDFSRYDSMIPMKRVAQPEDIAKVATFLCSDDAGYINGAVIPVDGGQSI